MFCVEQKHPIKLNNYAQLGDEHFADFAEANRNKTVDSSHAHTNPACNGHHELGTVNEKTGLVPASPQEETEEKRSRSRRRKLVFGLLFLACFGSGCGMSVPAPFYPREAAKKNVSSTSTGLVFGCFQMTNFIASPIFGHYLTDLGPRRVCITGMLVAGSCSVLFGFLDQVSSRSLFESLSFILRILEALGCSGFASATFTLISLECEDNIASSYAILEGAIGLGLMLGCTIGGGLYEVGGFGLPFWTIGAMIVLTGVILLLLLPHIQDKESSHPKGSILKLLKSPLIWVTMQLIFVGSASMIFLEPTLSIHLLKFHLTAFQVSLFFVICPMLHAILAPLYGHLSDRKNIVAPFMLTSCITCALGMLMIGPSQLLPFLPDQVWFKVLGMFVLGSFFSCTLVQTMKCLVTGARELGLPENMNTFGLVAGLFNSVFYFGSFVGPTIGGVMMDTIGFQAGTTILAASYLVTFIVLAVFFGFRRYKRSERETLMNEQSSDDIDPRRLSKLVPRS